MATANKLSRANSTRISTYVLMSYIPDHEHTDECGLKGKGKTRKIFKVTTLIRVTA
jgi:hypothetical protein